MNNIKLILLTLIVLFYTSSLSAQTPAAEGQAISFDPVIQSDPRISFSRGIEESVSPLSGSLSVKVPITSLDVHGLRSDLFFSYNSSMVSVFNEEELGGGGDWAHLSTTLNFSLRPEVGSLFYTKYGVSSYLGLVSEGMISETVAWLLSQIPEPISQTLSKVIRVATHFVHLDAIDNTTTHTFIPQMQLCAGPVRGLVGGYHSYSSLADFISTFVTGNNTSSARDETQPYNGITIHPLKDVNIILSDGSTVNFQPASEADYALNKSMVRYVNKQPDGHYKLSYNNGFYYFEMGDGVKYTIKPFINPLQYFGLAKFSLFSSPSNSGASPSELMQFLSELDSFSEDGLSSLNDALSLLGAQTITYVLPYGIVTKISDVHDNKISFKYEYDQFNNPIHISSVEDNFNRKIEMKYDSDRLLGLSRFYQLSNIILPDARKYRVTYSADILRAQPNTISIFDPLNRETKIGYLPFPIKLWPGITSIKEDFYYLNRIDYPIGGFVEYELAPLDDFMYNHYFYRDMDLTKYFVTSRKEHSGPEGSPNDLVETTRFEYNYNYTLDTLTTFALYFTPGISSVASAISDPTKLLNVFNGGVYFRTVREVTGGSTTVQRNDGTVETYYQKKSDPGSYNHYIATFGLGFQGMLSLLIPESITLGEAGYKPSRTLLEKSVIAPPAGNGEVTTTENTYYSYIKDPALNGRSWQVQNATVTKGSLVQTTSYLEYDTFGQPKISQGPILAGGDTSLALKNTTHYLYETSRSYTNSVFLPTLVREQIIEDASAGIQRRNISEYDDNSPGTSGYKGLNTKTIRQSTTGNIVTAMNYNFYGEMIRSTLLEPGKPSRITEMDTLYQPDGQDIIRINTRLKNIFLYDLNGQSAGTTDIQTSKEFGFKNGFLLNETDAKGNTVSYLNDALGRVNQVTFPDQTTLTYNFYDIKNDLHVDVKDEIQKGVTSAFLRYRYDGLGRLKSLEQHLNGLKDLGAGQANTVYTSENFYDANGNLARVRDAQGRETRLTYDGYKRLKQISYPDGTALSTSYDYSSASTHYLQHLTDANGTVTTYKFDALGRLVQVREPMVDINGNPETDYAYDKFGNLLSFTTAPNSRAVRLTTSYQYDDLDRLKRETYSDGTIFHYNYDHAGNIISKTDAKNIAINYLYDEANRLIKVSYPSIQPGIVYQYDKNNNRTAMKDGIGTHTYQYNDRNWLMSESVPLPGPGGSTKTIQYKYNTVGDLTNTIAPDGLDIRYKINTLHRVMRINFSKDSSPLSLLANYEYNSMGTVKKISLGNNAIQNFTYDTRDRLTLTKVESPAGLLMNQEYGYDSVGNRTRFKEESGEEIKYTYDSLYRLTGIKRPGKIPNKEDDTIYEYDRLGNRMSLRHTFGDLRHNYLYAANDNKLTNVTLDIAGKIRYTYDLNGNQISEEHSRNAKVFKKVALDWDYENRLTRMSYPFITDAVYTGSDDPDRKIKDSILEFTYDGDGKRVKKRLLYGTMVSEEKTYLYDSSGQVIAEYLASYDPYGIIDEMTTNRYVPGLMRITGTSSEYYIKDALGSTVLLLNDASKIIQRNKFDPYGEIEYSKGISDNKFNFTGKESDEESGLIYFGARFFNPFIGRWVSKDKEPGSTIFPQTLNQYSYCINNPFIFYDPDGNYLKNTVLRQFSLEAETSQYKIGKEAMKKYIVEGGKVPWARDINDLGNDKADLDDINNGKDNPHGAYLLGIQDSWSISSSLSIAGGMIGGVINAKLAKILEGPILGILTKNKSSYDKIMDRFFKSPVGKEMLKNEKVKKKVFEYMERIGRQTGKIKGGPNKGMSPIKDKKPPELKPSYQVKDDK